MCWTGISSRKAETIRFLSFFFKGRRAACYIKKEKAKDGHSSTEQGALACHAPKVKYTQKRIKKKVEELQDVLLRPLSKASFHL